jgi:hypothetical protein
MAFAHISGPLFNLDSINKIEYGAMKVDNQTEKLTARECTMTVLHTGATKKYVAGWEVVFSAAGKAKKSAEGGKKVAGKKAAKKTTAKKSKKAKAGK